MRRSTPILDSNSKRSISVRDVFDPRGDSAEGKHDVEVVAASVTAMCIFLRVAFQRPIVPRRLLLTKKLRNHGCAIRRDTNGTTIAGMQFVRGIDAE